MDDRAKRICDELGVSREEAFSYLEGFGGDVDAAIEACRSKTLPLPSLTVKSSPGNEKYASEAPYIPPLMIDSGRSSNQPPGPQEEQPPQSRNELIKSFCEAVVGTNLEEAVQYLERNNWNIHQALGCFLDECRPTPSQMKSNRPTNWRSNAPLKIGGSNSQGSSALMGLASEASDALASEFLQGVSPLMGSFNLTPVNIRSSSSSCAVEVDPPESLNEEQRIFQAIPLMASSQVKIQNTQGSGNPTQSREENLSPPIDVWVDRICDAAGVSREEALFYLEGFKWKFDTAMEACLGKTLPPVKETAEAPPNSQSQLNNEHLIRSFQDAAFGATREDAIDYLNVCNWEVNQAVGFFIDGVSVEEAYAALNTSLRANRDLPLSSMGLPSQSQFQASLNQGVIGSSSSSINADPTETQRSVEEAGEENVTVVIPGMGSSQVDGKAVAEDSSTETTITITIVLADDGSGISIDLPFRSNQTVRDIRDAIDERTPDNDRDYYLQSMTGVDYRDMNITVHKISTGGSTILLQVFPDP